MSNVHDLFSDPNFERQVRKRYGGSGYTGGGDDGMWQQSVEHRLNDLSARVEGLRNEVRSDFRWTWTGLAAMFVLLAGLMIQGYLLLNERMQSIDNGINKLTSQASISARE